MKASVRKNDCRFWGWNNIPENQMWRQATRKILKMNIDHLHVVASLINCNSCCNFNISNFNISNFHFPMWEEGVLLQQVLMQAGELTLGRFDL